MGQPDSFSARQLAAALDRTSFSVAGLRWDMRVAGVEECSSRRWILTATLAGSTDIELMLRVDPRFPLSRVIAVSLRSIAEWLLTRPDVSIEHTDNGAASIVRAVVTFRQHSESDVSR